MEAKFSIRLQTVIRLSREEAVRLGHDYLGTEHLLLGVIREGKGVAIKILDALGVNLNELKKASEDAVRTKGWTLTIGKISMTTQAEKVLSTAEFEAKRYNYDVVDTEHLLLSILTDEHNLAAKILHAHNVQYGDVQRTIDELLK